MAITLPTGSPAINNSCISKRGIFTFFFFLSFFSAFLISTSGQAELLRDREKGGRREEGIMSVSSLIAIFNASTPLLCHGDRFAYKIKK